MKTHPNPRPARKAKKKRAKGIAFSNWGYDNKTGNFTFGKPEKPRPLTDARVRAFVIGVLAHINGRRA